MSRSDHTHDLWKGVEDESKVVGNDNKKRKVLIKRERCRLRHRENQSHGNLIRSR